MTKRINKTSTAYKNVQTLYIFIASIALSFFCSLSATAGVTLKQGIITDHMNKEKPLFYRKSKGWKYSGYTPFGDPIGKSTSLIQRSSGKNEPAWIQYKASKGCVFETIEATFINPPPNWGHATNELQIKVKDKWIPVKPSSSTESKAINDNTHWNTICWRLAGLASRPEDIRLLVNHKNEKVDYSPNITSVRMTVTPKYLRGFTVPTLEKKTVDDAVKNWNVNFLRLMVRLNSLVHTPQFKGDYNAAFNWYLKQLPDWLDYAHEKGITVVIDMHGLVSPNESLYGKREWWSYENLKIMSNSWKKIAEITTKRPEQQIWLELLNEPLDFAEYPRFPSLLPLWGQHLIDTVRTIDKVHPIVIPTGPGMMTSGFEGFPHLYDEQNMLIYTLHQWQPLEYTHQGINNNPAGLEYPGEFKDMGGGMWDKARLRKNLEPGIKFQKKYNVRMYVGEFGASPWSPGQEKYIQDNIELFEELGWDWAFHAFREFSGWSPEYIGDSIEKLKKSEELTPCGNVLMKYFRQNPKRLKSLKKNGGQK